MKLPRLMRTIPSVCHLSINLSIKRKTLKLVNLNYNLIKTNWLPKILWRKRFNSNNKFISKNIISMNKRKFIIKK